MTNKEPKYTLILTSLFKKDLRALKKSGYDMRKLEEVVKTLVMGLPLDEKYKDHKLIGNYQGRRECHIAPDWLLIYEIHEDELILLLTRTGSHSKLF